MCPFSSVGLGGVRFLVECKHVPMNHTVDWEADAATATIKTNEILSSWILETPEQWFWIHRRWKDSTGED